MSNVANITLDDASPLFVYSGVWNTDQSGDRFVSSYFRSTYRSSLVNGDSVTLAFNGTGITCFGAKRVDHGFYNSSLDGSVPITTSGESKVDQFQVPLFSSGELTDGAHILVLTNANALNPTDKAGNNVFDLDFCDYTFATGDVGTSSLRTIIDDSAPAFTYMGPAWTDNFPAILKQPNYFDRTGHITGGTGDSMTFEFVGTAVQIMGAVNFNHGQFTVELDRVPFPSLDGLYDHLQTSVPIFVATGLENGTHTLTITNDGVGDINDLDIDFAVVDMPVAGAGAVQTINALSAAAITGEYPALPSTVLASSNRETIAPVASAMAAGDAPAFSLSTSSANWIKAGTAAQSNDSVTTQGVNHTKGLAIAIAVLGSVALVAGAIALVLFQRRRRRANKPREWMPALGGHEKVSVGI